MSQVRTEEQLDKQEKESIQHYLEMRVIEKLAPLKLDCFRAKKERGEVFIPGGNIWSFAKNRSKDYKNRRNKIFNE